MEFRVSQGAVELARHHEGFRANAYLDPIKIPTIGYGLTRYFHRPGAPRVQMGEVISHDEAMYGLLYTLQMFMNEVAPRIRVPLTQNQIDAIASFVYNVGVTNFLNSTMLRMLNAGDYRGAADQFPRWNRAGGKVFNGLVRRRAEERELFLRP